MIKTNLTHHYWSISQQITHHTVSGCPLRVGTLIATGTVSGPEYTSYGSLLEWKRAGKIDKYLEDGEEVVIKGTAGKISFGELRNKIINF